MQCIYAWNFRNIRHFTYTLDIVDNARLGFAEQCIYWKGYIYPISAIKTKHSGQEKWANTESMANQKCTWLTVIWLILTWKYLFYHKKARFSDNNRSKKAQVHQEIYIYLKPEEMAMSLTFLGHCRWLKYPRVCEWGVVNLNYPTWYL